MKITLVLFIRPTKRSVNDNDIMCSKSRTFEPCGVDRSSVHDPLDYIGSRRYMFASSSRPRLGTASLPLRPVMVMAGRSSISGLNAMRSELGRFALPILPERVMRAVHSDRFPALSIERYRYYNIV